MSVTKYEVYGRVSGRWQPVGQADGWNGDAAIDEAINVHQPNLPSLATSEGVEFMAVPASRVTIGWRRLTTVTSIERIDPPADAAVQQEIVDALNEIPETAPVVPLRAAQEAPEQEDDGA